MAGLKENAAQRALLVKARGLKPDDEEDDDAPAVESMADLAQQPKSWLNSFAPMVTTLRRSTMQKIENSTTSASITDVPPLFQPVDGTVIKAAVPEWGASTEVPTMTPPPGPPPGPKPTGPSPKVPPPPPPKKKQDSDDEEISTDFAIDRGSKTPPIGCIHRPLSKEDAASEAVLAMEKLAALQKEQTHGFQAAHAPKEWQGQTSERDKETYW